MSAMVVWANMAAVNALRNLKITGNRQNTAMERLSSGFRINRSADDAAGLAISVKMKNQVMGLRKAEQNVKDGINVCKTMDGGMSGIQDIMRRQRELVVQSLNDTNTSEDIGKIQVELDQLTYEIDGIAYKTQFNTVDLLCVPEGGSSVLGTGGDGTFAISNITTLSPSISVTQGDSTVDVNGIPTAADMFMVTGGQVGPSGPVPGWGVSVDVVDIYTNSADLIIQAVDYSPPRNGQHWPDLNLILVNRETGTQVIFGFDGIVRYPLAGNPYGEMYAPDGNIYGSAGYMVDRNDFSFSANIEGGGRIEYSGIGGNPEAFYIYGLPTKYYIKAYIHNGNEGLINIDPNFPSVSDETKVSHEFTLKIETPVREAQPRESYQQGKMLIQSGANEFQALAIDLYDCRAESLYGAAYKLSVLTRRQGESSLETLDAAFGKVSGFRANAGAQQNRLEHTERYLSEAYTNLEDADSRIADADMAKEMMELTKANILRQAGVAMLSQANQDAERILRLLSFRT